MIQLGYENKANKVLDILDKFPYTGIAMKVKQVVRMSWQGNRQALYFEKIDGAYAPIGVYETDGEFRLLHPGQTYEIGSMHADLEKRFPQ